MSRGMYLVLSLGLAGVAAVAEKAGPEEAVFEMREVSAFDKNDSSARQNLTRGEYAACSTEPDKEVKAYPKLKSKHPLYGKVVFGRSLSDRKGIEFHFVLDESGESPAPERKSEDKKKEEKKPEKSALDRLIEKLLGATEKKSPPVQPSHNETKLSRYDRLYFDINHDLDLRNDLVLKPLKDAPWSALPQWQVGERMAFEYLNVNFDYGPGVGMRPFRILPWLTVSQEDKRTHTVMHFVAAVVREGSIRIGKHEYDAILAQPYAISGRFDRPGTGLYLTPKDPKEKPLDWGWESNELMGMQPVDGQLYTLSATPLGDKLTVRPYHGDFGLFEIGPGGRKIKDIAFQGSFRTEKMAVGFRSDREKSPGQEEKIKTFKLPVGDYVPSYLSIEYGKLQIAISDNYHSEGRPREMERRRTYGIKIRKDKPFVLDFSHKPEILFASPAKDQTFKPGDEIKIAAVLVDPTLDIMIRRLNIETPTVTITDAAGKKVAEGPMPFG